ncbi:MAG: TRAP transporter small permease [Alphaproteobacteria bacterium]|nr:TRAP transporter small permease [Alphaproteobacteria bacterium]MDX5369739.1 TRAP transporter small permease [Alphaproteobacteria bacterium]MDX5464363.1 TRAP transporter small permease [Alphaproteobacteria bacterium]
MVLGFFRWSTQTFLRLSGIALLLMMVQINLDVAGRYLLNEPLPGTTEIVTAYLMVAIVFLPLARVEMADAHISVDLIAQFLPVKAQLRLQALACAAGAAFFGLLTASSWQSAMGKYRIGEYVMGEFSVVVWPSRFFVPLGCGLMTALLLYKGWRLLIGDDALVRDASAPAEH